MPPGGLRVVALLLLLAVTLCFGSSTNEDALLAFVNQVKILSLSMSWLTSRSLALIGGALVSAR
jgi:hypothetical protein